MENDFRFRKWRLEIALAINQLNQALRFVWISSPSLTIVAVLLVTLQGILPLAALYLMKLVIDAITATINAPPEVTTDFTRIGVLILLEGVVALVLALSSVAARWVSDIHSEIVTDYMHKITHSKSLEIDLEYFETAKYHDSQHRAQLEATFRPSKILNDFISLAQNGISLLAMASLLFFFHWTIVIILFFAVVPGILVRIKYSGILYKWHRSRTQTERKVQYFHWMLVGEDMAKEIRLFNLGKLFMDKYGRLRKRLRGERRTLTSKKALAEGITQITSNVAVYGSYGFIAYRTFHGIISLGDLIMYYRAFQKGQNFLRQMLGSMASLYEDNLYLSDLFEFLDLDKKVKEPSNPLPVPQPIQKSIVVDKLTFKYPLSTDRVALDQVDITIHPGQTIALVGENGSGKTTLIKLLCRLYDPTCGSITFDGIDIRHFLTEDLRREFSVIFQDFAQYSMTAKENIGMGDTRKLDDMNQIRAAAMRSGADKVISSLAGGYDTMLGKWFEHGEQLSYGEWQKVALARAMVRDSQIIILDEPTSSIDAKAEYEIFKNFKELATDKTTILISHRFSTVRMADCIYVLANGKIIEHGSHDELIAANGKYSRMFEMQAKAYR